MDEETRRAFTSIAAIFGVTSLGVAAVVSMPDPEAVAVAAVNVLMDLVLALRVRHALGDGE